MTTGLACLVHPADWLAAALRVKSGDWCYWHWLEGCVVDGLEGYWLET